MITKSGCKPIFVYGLLWGELSKREKEVDHKDVMIFVRELHPSWNESLKNNQL